MADPRETAAAFGRDLASVLGDRLKSLLLYGSVPRGEAVPGVSDVNVLVLLDVVDARALRQLSPLARRWAQAGNSVPLVMAWNEWRRAADAFAIEMADMRDVHEVLHGSDPLAGLEVDRTALRLQAERELRGKLLQLREGMLLAADEPEQVGQLLLAALPSFTTYLRAALRLAGRDVPRATEAVIEEGARLVDGDGDPFLQVWRARKQNAKLRVRIDEPLATGYYALAERTATFVDSLPEVRSE